MLQYLIIYITCGFTCTCTNSKTHLYALQKFYGTKQTVHKTNSAK